MNSRAHCQSRGPRIRKLPLQLLSSFYRTDHWTPECRVRRLPRPQLMVHTRGLATAHLNSAAENPTSPHTCLPAANSPNRRRMPPPPFCLRNILPVHSIGRNEFVSRNLGAKGNYSRSASRSAVLHWKEMGIDVPKFNTSGPYPHLEKPLLSHWLQLSHRTLLAARESGI